MARIKLLDKEFETYIEYDIVKKAIERVAHEISNDLKNEDVLFICILNGSFWFTAELFKDVDLVEPEVTFLKLSSYDGIDTTGQVKKLIGLNEPVKGRTLVVLEDIVDTGTTIIEVMNILKEHNPKSVKIATLLLKPEKFNNKMPLDYVGLEIGNEFIVGWGLDYNQKGRNLRDIYKVVE
ncbi:MAG TPA: hypoxanthine phosphoribosyltransferase [Prolixibacteraceae bacterium]|nr:hypoxanthine phosphoribosyltransferase [Bacteroidales bacterium]HPB05433.1 hypoxanthine phosphoribosyltransferase [Prolixibacteraceae bacterium]HQN93542.1 hypoxanthine phosphoribosyltransferase [Prolixibacteraceae bacterium]